MSSQERKLFLKQAPGGKGADRCEQPLDPPQLDCLPVDHGPGAEEHADTQSSYRAEYANQKGEHGRCFEPKRRTERGEFSKTRYFQRARSTNAQIGSAGATSMAEK